VKDGAPLTAAQRDALRELANVGAGHAATALGRLLAGERLSFAPPEVWTQTAVPWGERLHGYAPWVAAVVPLAGDMRGALWFLFGQKDAETFAGRLQASPAGRPSVETALLLLAHRAGDAARVAMGRLTGLAFDGLEAVVQKSRVPDAHQPSAPPEAPGPVVGVRLQGRGFAAQFLLVPGAACLDALLHSLRV